MSTALASREKQSQIKDLLIKARQSIADVLPKHLTPERVMKIALQATSRSPSLLQCTPLSVLNAVVQASQMGLEPGSVLGTAYLVPFKDQCQLIVGFRGFIELARRSGQIASIEAHVVNSKDKFKIAYGLNPVLEHEPNLSDDPGEFMAVYAVAQMKDGTRQCEVMTRAQVDHIRAKSRASENGPWVTDFDEMARKTVVKRLCKYLPLSVEMASAVDLDNQAEVGEQAINIIDIPEQEESAKVTPITSRTADLKEELKAKKTKKKEESSVKFEDGTDVPTETEREPGEEG